MVRYLICQIQSTERELMVTPSLLELPFLRPLIRGSSSSLYTFTPIQKNVLLNQSA